MNTVARVSLLIAAFVTVAVASWQLGSRARSPAEVAARATPPRPAVITAPVQRRTLARTLRLTGTVAWPGQRRLTVDATLTGDPPIVTAHPLPAGAEVRNGTVVAEVAARPLFALDGQMPMYRDLRIGSAGRDVRQLRAALAAAGLDAGPDTDVLGDGIAAAVAELYRAHGYGPPGAHDPAAQRPATGGAPATTADDDGGGGETSQQQPRPDAAQGAIVLPRAEAAFLPRLPARLVDHGTAVGASAGASVATIAAGSPQVRVKLAPGDRSDLASGTPVSVSATDTGRPLANGIVSALNDRSAVVLTRRPLPRALLGREVRVDGRRVLARRMLTVPLAAVSALPDGGSRVTVARGDRLIAVRVRPGASADGYVAVSVLDDSLRAADEVVVGR